LTGPEACTSRTEEEFFSSFKPFPLISIYGNHGNFRINGCPHTVGESFTVGFYSFAQQLLRHRRSARRTSAMAPLSIDISRREALSLTRKEFFLHY
jgi:hypothetical protein